MAISAVGSLVTGMASGTTVSPTAIGDVAILSLLYQTGTAAPTGGGVTTWTKLTPTASSAGPFSEIWWGVITATGSSTVSSGGTNSQLSYQQFHSSVAGTWAADGAGAAASGTASSGTWPSLTPGSNELYVGAGNFYAAPSGSTAGFTYSFWSSEFGFVYSLNASGAQAPGWAQPRALYAVTSGMLKCTVTSPATGTLQATFTAGFSPEAIGEPMGLQASFVAGLSPVKIGVPMALQATFVASETLALALPTASLSATFVASATVGLALPGAKLQASFVASLSPEAIGEPMGLVASFTASTSPLVIVRGSGTLLATFFTASVTTVIVPGAAGRLTATFVASVTQSGIAVSLPSTQSGATPTTFHLNEHYKIWVVVGVPPAPMGNNGDLAYRKDTLTGSGAKVYSRASNAWTAIA